MRTADRRMRVRVYRTGSRPAGHHPYAPLILRTRQPPCGLAALPQDLPHEFVNGDIAPAFTASTSAMMLIASTSASTSLKREHVASRAGGAPLVRRRQPPLADTSASVGVLRREDLDGRCAGLHEFALAAWPGPGRHAAAAQRQAPLLSAGAEPEPPYRPWRCRRRLQCLAACCHGAHRCAARRCLGNLRRRRPASAPCSSWPTPSTPAPTAST